jgi:3-deoxy-D-manno-octulosonic-acid transferase/heptosyltransferase-1
MTRTPENILIVKLSAIGDVIHTLPALNAVRRHCPQARITWLIEEAAIGLIEHHSALDRVLVSKRKYWLRGLRGPERVRHAGAILRFLRELRDTRYDIIFDFQASLKGGMLVALARGNRKIGFGRGLEHQEHSYLFLNETVPAVDMEIHALTRGLILIEKAGIPVERIEYRLPVTGRDRDDIQRVLADAGIPRGGNVVAINPIAQWETKLWESSKFAALADLLVERYDVPNVFSGGSADRPVIAEIVERMHSRAVNLAGRTSLMGLAALYERCTLLVSTDTGPMHLGAAVGIPVVALFGPTAPWRTGPFGKGHRVVRTDCDCAPCFQRRCATTHCMTGITVAKVMAAIEQLQAL